MAETMRSWEAKKMRGEPARNWSPNLQTSVDGHSGGSWPDRPEMTRILSSSRAGRMHWHRNQFVPLPCRPPNPDKQLEEFMAPEHRQHLIYLALYRDKIDQHQAAMAKPKSPEGRARSPSPPAEEAETEIHATSGFAATTGGMYDHTGKTGYDHRRPRTAAAAHTATVKATSASGLGYLDEHAEAKRLGKLFDEWVSKQDIDAAYESVALPSPRAEGRRVKVEASQAKSRRLRSFASKGRRHSGGSNLKSTQTAKSEEDEASCLGDHPSVGTASSWHHRRFPADPADRRKLERLWMVMTNPKIRSASLSDKASHERVRQVPTRIEGIKPLMLYKLYHGPWRLDI
ncbi:trappc4 [Symbiodinium natans]|uniref:Trappc4 protein n=1 Tax=Symbiodinium natans TaxID=878477 RepID=A0A812GRH2_9DINO|nr:trappc4 [Symbiodinium natans]